jgi:hypothetical protein
MKCPPDNSQIQAGVCPVQYENDDITGRLIEGPRLGTGSASVCVAKPGMSLKWSSKKAWTGTGHHQEWARPIKKSGSVLCQGVTARYALMKETRLDYSNDPIMSNYRGTSVKVRRNIELITWHFGLLFWIERRKEIHYDWVRCL